MSSVWLFFADRSPRCRHLAAGLDAGLSLHEQQVDNPVRSRSVWLQVLHTVELAMPAVLQALRAGPVVPGWSRGA